MCIRDRFWGFPCVDGDADDIRPYDPKGGHVIVLAPKGEAKGDDSGFVRKRDEVAPARHLLMVG